MLVTTNTTLNQIKELEKDLKIQHCIFAREYAIDGNGTRAYKVAYPKAKLETARSKAPDLLKKIAISSTIALWIEYNRLNILKEKDGIIAHLMKQIEICGELQSIDSQHGSKLQMVDAIGYKTALTELNKITGVYTDTKIKIDFVGAELFGEDVKGDFIKFIKNQNGNSN